MGVVGRSVRRGGVSLEVGVVKGGVSDKGKGQFSSGCGKGEVS